MAPAYHQKEGAAMHPGACKFSLLYDGRPDERSVVRGGTLNLGSLSRNRGAICEELRKGMIDVCYLLEVRWGGQDARMREMKGRRYKLWWSEK